jgi:hypothetical protein
LQSAIIKFRITPREKDRLANVARSADMTVSALMRRTAVVAAAGRPLDRQARLNIAAMRSAANLVSAAIDELRSDPSVASIRLREAASELHRIAVRQLDASR